MTNTLVAPPTVLFDDLDVDLDLKVKEAEAITGSHASVARFEFNRLRQLGVLLKVHVTGSSIFQIAAHFYEYGVSEETKVGKGTRRTRRRDVLLPGMKNVIPRDLIDKRHSRENRARYCPKKFGYSDLFSDEISHYDWVPFTAWKDFLDRWQPIVAEDEKWKADLIKNHAKHRKWCEATFTQAAKEAWAAIMAKRRLKPGEPLKIDKHSFVNRESFIKWVVDDALAHFPSKEEIAEKCQIGYRISVLATSADLDAESAKQETAQAELAEAQTREQNAHTEAWAKVEEARAKLKAMHEAEKEAALAQLEATRPLAAFVTALNGKMLEMIQQFRKSLDTGSVPDKTAKFGRSLIDVYQTLNAGVSDEKTIALLSDLRDKIGTSPQARNIGDVEKAVKALEKELSKNVAEILDAEPNRFRFLEMD
jgi:hypothetical protein